MSRIFIQDGYINNNTFFYEAKEIYPIFLLIANCAAIIGGEILQILTFKTQHHFLDFFNSAWKQSFVAQLLVVILLCGLIIIIFLKFSDLLEKDSNMIKLNQI